MAKQVRYYRVIALISVKIDCPELGYRRTRACEISQRGTIFIDISEMVASHFVPGSFRTYLLVISYPVTTISYPGHFVPILVISYLSQLSTKWLHGGQFVPKLFRSLFGHFVPILVISYPAKMDGWIDERTDGRTGVFWLKCQINVSLFVTLWYFVIFWNPLIIAKPFCRRLQTRQNKGARRQSLVSLVSLISGILQVRRQLYVLRRPLVFGIQTMLLKMDGWMDGWMGRQTDRQDRQTDRLKDDKKKKKKKMNFEKSNFGC